MYIVTRCPLDRCSARVRAISSAFWEVVPIGRGAVSITASEVTTAKAVHIWPSEARRELPSTKSRVRQRLIRESWVRGREVLQELRARMSVFRGRRGCRQQSSRV